MANIMTNGNGGISIRIGDNRDESVKNGYHTNDMVTQNTGPDITAGDSKELQRVKNEAYRNSTPSNYLKIEGRMNLAENGKPKREVQANHIIYTKVSSAIVAKSSASASSQAFTTRNIRSSKVSQAVFIPVNNDNEFENKNNNCENDDVTDDDAYKLLRMSQQRDPKYQNGPLPDKDSCFYCRKTVYAKEKIGPVRDVLYHKQCFRCAVCNFQLTLSNFCQNPRDPTDRRMYCKSHQPLPETARLDIRDTSIKAVINKPRMEQHNPNVRGGPDAAHRSIPADSLNIRGPLAAPKLEVYHATVRPVPALAMALARSPAQDPDAYKSRQLSNGVSLAAPPHRPDGGPGLTDDTLCSYLLQ